MLYFSLYSLSIVFSYIALLFFVKNNKSSTYCIIPFALYIFLLFFYGLRSSDSGTDTENYLIMLHNLDYNSRIEPLFLVALHVLKMFTLNNQMTIFLLYIIPVSIIFYTVIKIYSLKNTCIILFLITFSFSFFDLSSNIIRQFWASSFWLLGLSYFVMPRKKTILGSILIICSILFHYSYIIPSGILFFLLVLNNRISIKFDYFLLLFLMIMSLFSIFKIDLFTTIISSLVDILAQIVNSLGAQSAASFLRLINRYGYNITTQGSLNEVTIIPLIIEIFTILIPFYIYVFFCKKSERGYLVARFFALMSLTYLILGYQSMSYRYSYMALVVLPLIWGEINIGLNKYNRVIAIIVVPISYVYFWFRVNYLHFDWIL